MQTITQDIKQLKEDVTAIQESPNESAGIKEQLLATQGKVARLELKNQTLENKLVEFESRLFEKDLAFYNVDEQQHETEQSLKTTIYNTIKDIMKVPITQIFSKINPTGDVRIDTVSRVGRYNQERKRPVIVTFISKCARNMTYSKVYTANLKTPLTTIRVAEHYPAIIREKRQAQIDSLKELRIAHKEVDTTVTMNKDKILIDGKFKDTFNFERNTLGTLTPFSIHYDKIAHTEKITDKGSTFQGHILPVTTLNEAIATKNALLQNPDLSAATHLTYAYTMGHSITAFNQVSSMTMRSEPAKF